MLTRSGSASALAIEAIRSALSVGSSAVLGAQHAAAEGPTVGRGRAVLISMTVHLKDRSKPPVFGEELRVAAQG